ncbi:MAG TPA: sulfotransferase [Roseiarcus sp.]|jgi:Flp pilus assembly protein TadD
MQSSKVASVRIGRNDLCPCGSGKKYKHCCEGKQGLPFSTGIEPLSGLGRKQKLRTFSQSANELARAGRFSEAVHALSEIARLDPGDAQAHYNLGAALLSLGAPGQATASLQRALELKPSLTAARVRLANALELSGSKSEALLIYRKLCRAAGDVSEKLEYSAIALALEGKMGEAADEFRRLAAFAPNNPNARLLLGKALAEAGRLDEAASEIEPIVDALPAAFARLADVRRMTEADRPLIERVRRIADSPAIEPSVRIPLEFGLGKSFDDLGEYGEAIRHYDAANAMRAQTTRIDRAWLAKQYDDMIAAYAGDARQRGSWSATRPASVQLRSTDEELPVFIVGMPRSGTTLVEQILSAHPAVTAGGELRFWSDQIQKGRISANAPPDADALSEAANDYLTALREIGAHALRITDKDPMNYERLGLIRMALPSARVIHCRRHPIDTALSEYFTNFGGRQTYASDRGDIVFFYRQYQRLMNHWRRVLPSGRFTEVDYEELVTNRQAVTRRLIAFLELPWDDACVSPERNTRPVHTASVWQARQPVYSTSVERWRHYEPWLGELRELLPPTADP